jgi:hypothetical protein
MRAREFFLAKRRGVPRFESGAPQIVRGNLEIDFAAFCGKRYPRAIMRDINGDDLGLAKNVVKIVVYTPILRCADHKRDR